MPLKSSNITNNCENLQKTMAVISQNNIRVVKLFIKHDYSSWRHFFVSPISK